MKVATIIKNFWFNHTSANFTSCPEIDEDIWKKMKTDVEGYDHWESPTSPAEFILSQDFIIYRRAKTWGKVGSCVWDLDGNSVSTGNPIVAKCSLRDFHNLKKE